MLKTNKPARGKLHVGIPRPLLDRIRAAIAKADLAAITVTSVVTNALEAYLPTLEAVAVESEKRREITVDRAVLRRLEFHMKRNYPQPQPVTQEGVAA